MATPIDFIPQLVNWISTAGIAVFALSGAVYAAEKEIDILGFVLIGTVTGIGGGTLRDLLLNVPVFWVQQPFYIYICIIATVLAYFTASQIHVRHRWMLWFDAAGLAAFTVVGTQISLTHGAHPAIAIVMGVISATFGGVIRDMLCAETLTLTQSELYISCALLGASLFALLDGLGMHTNLAIGLSYIASFGLRAIAIIFGVKLPKYSLKIPD